MLSSTGHSAGYGALENTEIEEVLGSPRANSLVESISNNIFELGNAATVLERLQKQIGTPRDSQSLRDEIHMIQQQTNRRIHETPNLLASFRREVPGTRPRLRAQRLRSDFEAALKSYSAAQKTVSVTLRRHLLPPSSPSSTEQGNDAADQDYEQRQRQLQLQEAIRREEEDQEVLRQRAERIRQIETDVVDVNVIMKQLAAMVQEQAETVENIDTNVEEAHVNVSQAGEQIRIASQYQTKFRRNICVFIVFLILVAIVITVIVLVMKET